MNIVKGIITGLEFDDDLPSGRILFALEAMRYFEKTDGLEVAMENFRMKGGLAKGGICYACCGGAARSVREGWLTYDTFEIEKDRDIVSYETSLDYARMGDVCMMFEMMNSHISRGAYNRNITEYDEDPEQFYSDMTQLATDLQQDNF